MVEEVGGQFGALDSDVSMECEAVVDVGDEHQ